MSKTFDIMDLGIGSGSRMFKEWVMRVGGGEGQENKDSRSFSI